MVLSFLVLAAHFLRSGNVVMVGIVLVCVGLLAVRRGWAARSVQVALLLGAAEWLRTLAQLVSSRTSAGQPVLRLSLILGGVALLTALSALVFLVPRLRGWYQSGNNATGGLR